MTSGHGVVGLHSGEINFEDTKVAFSWASDSDMQKMALLYRMMQSPIVSNYGARLTSLALNLGLPITPVVRNTVFEQFCGGETLEQCKGVIAQLAEYNVGTVLDYSAEGGTHEADFDATRDEILRGIEFAASRPEVRFVVFKISGMGSLNLLEKMDAGTKLSKEEEVSKQKLLARVDKICAEAAAKNMRVFMDAEESWVQDAIDSIAEDMMRRYNLNETYIFTTVQMYRKDRLKYLKHLLYQAHNEKFFVGIKLVRGAYMEKERERAKAEGKPSPIYPSKAATDRAYNEALELLIDEDHAAFVAGTHNLESTRYLTDLIRRRRISKEDRRVEFSQLLGMSANLTFNLAKAGFNVSKYVPYGPVRRVMPYLVRRAQENTAIRGQTSRELAFIQREIERRKEDNGNVSTHASLSRQP